jgi:glycosyltransferase involved in cell wall biosynthesis
MKGLLSNKKSIWFWLNKIFISRLGAVIVEGQFQADYFKNVINENRIHIIPNFAQRFLFTNPDSIIKKFEDVAKIKVLFLSNLLFGKGHYELLEAFQTLNKNEREYFEINFAGGFENDKEKEKFIKLIQPYSQLNYLGHVGGEKKAELFKSAHLFCLPTYYPFEGQPFVIIEAYAAGCAVITTDHSGIPYIFKDNLNGILVEKKSVLSLKEILKGVSVGEFPLRDFAFYNLKEASQIYTEEKYLEKVISVFKKVSEKE